MIRKCKGYYHKGRRSFLLYPVLCRAHAGSMARARRAAAAPSRPAARVPPTRKHRRHVHGDHGTPLLKFPVKAPHPLGVPRGGERVGA